MPERDTPQPAPTTPLHRTPAPQQQRPQGQRPQPEQTHTRITAIETRQRIAGIHDPWCKALAGQHTEEGPVPCNCYWSDDTPDDDTPQPAPVAVTVTSAAQMTRAGGLYDLTRNDGLRQPGLYILRSPGNPVAIRLWGLL